MAHRTIRHWQAGRFIICKQDISSYASRTIRHLHAGRFVICTQDDSSLASRTIHHLHARRLIICKRDDSSFQNRTSRDSQARPFLSSYHTMIRPPDRIIISSYNQNIHVPLFSEFSGSFRDSCELWWVVTRVDQILGRSAKFAKKWHEKLSNFKRMKNREDGSDFDNLFTQSNTMV